MRDVEFLYHHLFSSTTTTQQATTIRQNKPDMAPKHIEVAKTTSDILKTARKTNAIQSTL